MRKAGNFIKQKLLAPAMVAAAAAMLLMIIVLMFPPVIGMADNGDFYRAINGQGIYKIDRYEKDQYFDYFSSEYGIYQYHNESEKSLFSSHNLYIQGALFLNRVFSEDKQMFDIRFLAVFMMVELAAGIFLLVDYITYGKKRLQGFLLGAVCVFMFADTAYTAYFNSFYSEGIVFVSFLLLTASALLLTQKRYPPMLLLFSVLINGIILIFTKQQNATEGLPLFVLCIFIAFFFQEKSRAFRAVAITGAVSMAVCGIAMYVLIPEDFVKINQYHAMTRGALMTGSNPEETLEEFGIDRQYSILEGSIYYERYPAADVESEQLVENFYEKYGFVSLSVYYLTHLDELISMLERAAESGYMIRPLMQGNYEKSAGKAPGERTYFFTGYSSIKETAVPGTVGFVLIWLLLACALCIRNKQKLMIVLCVAVMGIIQVGTSIIGAGDADLSKHIFMYNVAFDLISFICFAPILTSIVEKLLSGIYHFLTGRKKALAAGAVLALALLLPVHEVRAEEQQERVVLIYQTGQEIDEIVALIQACGMEAEAWNELYYDKSLLDRADYVITTAAGLSEDILKSRIPSLFLGPRFTEVPGAELSYFQDKWVAFEYNGYKGERTLLEEVTAIASSTGEQIGRLLIGEEEEMAFAVKAEDGNIYAPCYDVQNQGSIVLLGAVISELTGNHEEGKLYYLLDEIYVFSDLEKIADWGTALHDNGIPFLVRIMPIYEHLDYPAFARFIQTLRYLRTQGGTILIHEPIVQEEMQKQEDIEDKMLRFQAVLEEADIEYQELEESPYLFQPQDFLPLTSVSKNFGRLPFSLMIGVTPEMSQEEFDECLEKLNAKWLSFSGLDTRSYLYEEEEISDDFEYREKVEAAYEAFFNTGDRILIIVVGISLMILALLLFIGRKWYRKKFYRS